MTEQRNDDILSTENPSEIVGIKKVSKVKLSTKGRYGLRALIDLAANDTGEAVSIQSIAGRQNISESYLEQLIAKLRKAGLVVSVRPLKIINATPPSVRIDTDLSRWYCAGELNAVDYAAEHK